MNWPLIWVIGFLTLYVIVGARGLAAIVLTMIMGAVTVQTILGPSGLLVGGALGLMMGLILVYATHTKRPERGAAA